MVREFKLFRGKYCFNLQTAKETKYEYTDHLENQMLRKIYDCKEQKLRRGRGI